MIIGVDAGALGISDERLKVGVYRMSKSLIESLLKIDKYNSYILYSFYPLDKNYIRSLGKNAVNKVLPQKGWFKFWLPLALKKDKPDVFLGLSQSLPKLSQDTKGVVFIHDLTFEKNPEWFPNSYKNLSQNTKDAVQRSDRIIAVSKATKSDLINAYKIKPDKISVIYEGKDDRLLKIKGSEQSLKFTNYFLFVGTYKPSKNIPNILKAFSILIKKKSNIKLILVGSDYWQEQNIDKMIKDLNLSKNVISLKYVNDRDLAYLYTNAIAFISPSYNEGFGLSFLEASQFKLAIITSDRGSIKEVLGEGAIYVSPDSDTSIYKAMLKITVNGGLRKRIIQKAEENIKKFSWSKSARQLLKLINE